jgi:hypothetical protein
MSSAQFRNTAIRTQVQKLSFREVYLTFETNYACLLIVKCVTITIQRLSNDMVIFSGLRINIYYVVNMAGKCDPGRLKTSSM